MVLSKRRFECKFNLIMYLKIGLKLKRAKSFFLPLLSHFWPARPNPPFSLWAWPNRPPHLPLSLSLADKWGPLVSIISSNRPLPPPLSLGSKTASSRSHDLPLSPAPRLQVESPRAPEPPPLPHFFLPCLCSTRISAEKPSPERRRDPPREAAVLSHLRLQSSRW